MPVSAGISGATQSKGVSANPTKPTAKATGELSSATSKEDQETKKEHAQEISPVATVVAVEVSDEVAPAKLVAKQLPKKANALPSFLMNDESKITVSLLSHELQESMARNSFSSKSYEGEV